MSVNKEYIESMVQDDERYMQHLKTNLSRIYMLEITCPFYSDMGNMPSENLAASIKNGSLQIMPMSNEATINDLENVTFTVRDEYKDEDIRLVSMLVDDGKNQNYWVLSSVDFSKEYQACLVIDEKDEVFYSQLRSNYMECRKAHNALMDILDRNITSADAVTLRALETLQLKPDCTDDKEMYNIILEIKQDMLDFCEDYNIDINPMNTLTPSQIIDIRNHGRDSLRDKDIDAILNQQINEIKEQESELSITEVGYERT
jgi:hypothetical protein